MSHASIPNAFGGGMMHLDPDIDSVMTNSLHLVRDGYPAKVFGVVMMRLMEDSNEMI